MKFASLLLCSYALISRFVAAKSSTGDRVLVVLEPELKKEDYSIFFNSLESRGFKLTFRAPSDPQPAVFVYDIPQFSHVILFAPTTKNFASDLAAVPLLHLLKEEPSTNLLVALSPKNTPLSSFAAEFSLILPPPNTPLMSHFPQRDTPHTTLTIPVSPSNSHPLLRKNMPPVVFEGQAHMLGDNPLLFPILNAPAESFSSDSDGDRLADGLVEASDRGGEGLWAGSKMGVASGFQTKSGARVTFVGGVKLFSDEFAEMEISPGKKSGNAKAAEDISAWTFKESMVLRVDSATHFVESDPAKVQKDQYTTNDRLTFKLQLSQYDGQSGQYRAKTGIEDMQLDFTMLDPHIRANLTAVKGEPGAYGVSFRAPDRHGVYKFAINYKRKGWTFVELALQVAIVPPRHDGYPRFLHAAWPYYAGAISSSVGFIFFCIIYLGGESQQERKRLAKGKGKVE